MFSPSRSLQVFPEHQVRALVSCIQPGLVICFTLDSIKKFLYARIFLVICSKVMNLESVIQREVSQKEKNKYFMLVHIYGI